MSTKTLSKPTTAAKAATKPVSSPANTLVKPVGVTTETIPAAKPVNKGTRNPFVGLTPITRAAYEILADGKWADREAVLSVLGKTVTPKQALSIVNARAEAQKFSAQGSKATLIARGRRYEANMILLRLVYGGHAERKGDKIRLTADRAKAYRAHRKSVAA